MLQQTQLRRQELEGRTKNKHETRYKRQDKRDMKQKRRRQYKGSKDRVQETTDGIQDISRHGNDREDT